jgi:hypothetical protein
LWAKVQLGFDCPNATFDATLSSADVACCITNPVFQLTRGGDATVCIVLQRLFVWYQNIANGVNPRQRRGLSSVVFYA